MLPSFIEIMVKSVCIQVSNAVSFSEKKSPRGIIPRHCSPSPHGAKYITVPQGTSPSLCSERHDEHLFGQAKTRGLGQVTMKKTQNKKNG